MATIKSYTDIEQSRKLAEILPYKSADMCIGNYVGKSGKVDGTNIHYFPKGESFGAPEIIDAWSLAALFSVLPEIQGSKPIIDLNDNYITYPHISDLHTKADNPVDACMAMIEKLHGLKLL